MSGRVRGFPAFPPTRGHGRFARSWWGRAWLAALEDTALAAEPLRTGRRYARTGNVGTITVSPGRLAAPVHDDTDDTDHATRMLLAPLADAEWDRFLGQVAAHSGHIAALLDGDMPHDLVVAAADAGVALLPGIGDLDPECDCPGWEHPCPHAAALAYQASWLLDADPFVLLLLRGRDRDELLDELTRRTTPPATDTHGAVRPLSAAADPELDLPAAPGVDPDALRWLVVHAANRASALLDGTEPDGLDRAQDIVRIAAADPGPLVRARLAAARPDLERAVTAWSYGGVAGLATLESPWTPPTAVLTRARGAWEPQDVPALTAWRNRWTVGDRQLRYGRDGRWYPYRARAGTWWPAGPPDRDPAAVLDQLDQP